MSSEDTMAGYSCRAHGVEMPWDDPEGTIELLLVEDYTFPNASGELLSSEHIARVRQARSLEAEP